MANKPTYEELERRLAEAERKLAESERDLKEQRDMALALNKALRAIDKETDLMRLEAFKFVVDTDDPVWIYNCKQITKFAALSARMAARLARHDLDRKKTERMQPPVGNGDTDESDNDDSDETESDGSRKSRKGRRPAQDIAEANAALEEVEAEDPTEEPFAKTIKDNSSTAVDLAVDETHQGKRNNYGEIRHLNKPVEIEPAEEAQCECPECHQKSEQILEQIEVTRAKLKRLEGEYAKSRAGYVEVENHVYYCHGCNKLFLHRPEGADHPLCLSRGVSCHSLLEIMYAQYHGIAINNAGRDFEKGAGLGGDTISRNIHDLDTYFFWWLYIELLKILQQEEVIGADETPFQVTSALFKSYVLSIGTPERATNRIELYRFLPRRTALAIAAALAEFKFKVLITDAFASYNKTMLEHPEAKRQSCLVHFRREMINGVWETQLARDFFALPDEDRKKFLLDERNRKGTFYLELLVFRAISQIYRLERELDASPNNIKEIRKKQKNLMDTIGKIMDKLSEGRVELKPSGRYWRKVGTDPLAGACVYWLNNEKQLRTFLDESSPMSTPPDNSVMERNIRPLAIVRNNSKFWISQEYAKQPLEDCLSSGLSRSTIST